jgi:hypothetical protein
MKRIVRYLCFTPEGLWYSSSSVLSLCSYSCANFAGCHLEHKSTSRTCQFLGTLLIFSSSRKQSSVAYLPQRLSMSLLLAFARSCFG